MTRVPRADVSWTDKQPIGDDMSFQLSDSALLRNSSFIDGVWQEGKGHKLPVVNPATGDVVAEVLTTDRVGTEKAIAAESNDETLSLEDRLPRRDQILEEMADKGIPQTASRYGTTVNQIILRRDIKQRHLAGVLGLPKINIPVGKVMRATGLSVRDYEGLFPHAFRV